ncbi:allantoinase AllB [Curtobacterium sp. MCBD17_034]|uniref:allantoinase AllB n=1 Tax=unclassified Curtobacterium TaxID=257496 RepID=UPI000DAA180A|nr:MULTISPECIES: allantoinase AllB [unclassified Curtobacterium]PZF59312.1 allantoinase AllB [Curtobacterium sp. MCBD17_034]PZM32850.1 allantoinase AllB [Curtobacterium sp. MCBD17_031]
MQPQRTDPGGAVHATAPVAVRGHHVWTDGAFRPATVLVRDGLVDAVLPLDAPVEVPVVELSAGRVLLPGLVDTHVHVNEPGRTEWEGFASATRAAALGGVTTIVDMPLNSVPPTTTVDALAVKRERAEGRVAVDVGFWGGAVPENLGALRPVWDAGVYGFKSFLAPSGVDEFGHLDADQLRRALAEIAAFDGVLIVHAEDPAHLADGGALGTGYGAFLASRPPAAEEDAIARVIDGVRATGARAHVLHLSDAGALPMLRAAKGEGLPITVETCPHYLTIDAESVPDGATEFKCCPPIREAGNQDALWAGLLDGTIDMVVTDHSPSTVDLKRGSGGDFGLAWGGIAGLQVGFRAMWTEAARRGVPLERIVPAFTTGPAALVGMTDRAAIAPGAVAHLVEFDPDAEDTVHVEALEHRNPISAYDGRTLRGRVTRTWLHGAQIATADQGVTAVAGRLLRRA